MSIKVIKNLTARWKWNGDFNSLKGFNIAICKSDSNPKLSIEANYFMEYDGNYKEEFNYSLNGIILDKDTNYKVWVQAVYPNKDSDWVSTGQATVTDDGNATIIVKNNKEIQDVINMAADNVITSQEKVAIRQQYHEMVAEYLQIIADADRTITNSNSNYTNYVNKMKTLSVYLHNGKDWNVTQEVLDQNLFPSLISPENKQDWGIDPNVYRTKFRDYYEAKVKILEAIKNASINDGISKIEFGGRNYLKKSKINLTSSEYLIASFYLGEEKPKENDVFTISIKGNLGKGKTSFGVYNSGGSISMLSLNKKDSNGIYKESFRWIINQGEYTAANTHINIFTLYNSVTVESSIEWVKLEKGNKATDWSPAPEDLDESINEAKSQAEIAKNQINEIVSDNVLSTIEKKSVDKMGKEIIAEYPGYIEQADRYPSINKTDYINSYNNLYSYLYGSNGVLSNLSTNTNINRTVFTQKFDIYFNSRKKLLSDLQLSLKNYVDDIQIGGRNLLTNNILNKFYGSAVKNEDGSYTLISSNSASYFQNDKVLEREEKDSEFTFSVDIKHLSGNKSKRVRITIWHDDYWDNYYISDLITNNFKRFSKTVKLKNASRIGLCIQIDDTDEVGNTFIFKHLKFEKGTKATDWTPAPEDIQEDIDNAKQQADSAMGKVNEFSNDNKLTPVEKKTTLNLVNEIKKKKPQLEAQASIYKISMINFNNAYENLISYTNPLLSNLNATSDINRNDFKSKFDNWYEQEAIVLREIQEAVKGTIDSIEVGGRNLMIGSSNIKYIGSANGIILSKDSDGSLKVVASYGNDNWVNLNIQRTENIENNLSEGDNVTLSAWMKSSDTDKIPTIYVKDGMGYYPLTGKMSSNYSQFSVTVKWKKNKGINFNLGFGHLNGTINILKLKVEKGNKATDWSPAPEDLDTAIAEAKQQANNAMGKVNEFSNDNKLTPVEKKSVFTIVNEIKKKKPQLETQANIYKISMTNFNNAYNNLINYIDPLLANTNETSDISRNTFESKFNEWYSQEAILLKEIQQAVKGSIDNIQIGGNNMISNSGNFVNTLNWRITNGNENLRVLDNVLVASFKDYSNWGCYLANFSLRNKPFNDLNQEYTVSFVCKTSVNTDLVFEIVDGDSLNSVISKNFSFTTEYKKYEFTFKPRTAGNERQFRFITSPRDFNFDFYLKWIKLEKGNKSTDWTPSTEDINNQIDEAKQQADNAMGKVNEFSNDNKLTPLEKKSTFTIIAEIKKKNPQLNAQADIYGITTTNFNNSYHSLINYIDPLLSNLNTTSDINRNEFKSKFDTWYNQEAILLREIQEAVKGTIDNIEVGGRNYFRRDTEIYTLTGIVNITKKPQTNGFSIGNGKEGGNSFRISDVIKGNGLWTFSALVSTNNGGPSQITVDICDLGVEPHTGSTNIELPIGGGGPNYSEYKKISFTVNVTNWTAETYNFVDISYPNWASIDFRDVKVEQGNKATGWTPAPEDLKNDIDNAKQQADNAMGKVNEFSNDNKLTPLEKKSTLTIVSGIKKKKPQLDTQATIFGISTNNFNDAYNTLISYIDPLLSNLNTTSDINRNEFKSKFDTWYNQEAILLREIQEASKGQIDNIHVGGTNLLLNSKFNYEHTTPNRGYLTEFPYAIFEKDDDVFAAKKFLSGKKLILSVYLEYEGATDGRIGIEFNGTADGGRFYRGAWASVSTNGRNFKGRLAIKLPEIPNNIVELSHVAVYDQLVGATKIKIANPKLEIGTAPTDWSPSPFDIENELENLDEGSKNYIRNGNFYDALETSMLSQSGYQLVSPEGWTYWEAKTYTAMSSQTNKEGIIFFYTKTQTQAGLLMTHLSDSSYCIDFRKIGPNKDVSFDFDFYYQNKVNNFNIAIEYWNGGLTAHDENMKQTILLSSDYTNRKPADTWHREHFVFKTPRNLSTYYFGRIIIYHGGWKDSTGYNTLLGFGNAVLTTGKMKHEWFLNDDDAKKEYIKSTNNFNLIKNSYFKYDGNGKALTALGQISSNAQEWTLGENPSGRPVVDGGCHIGIATGNESLPGGLNYCQIQCKQCDDRFGIRQNLTLKLETRYTISFYIAPMRCNNISIYVRDNNGGTPIVSKMFDISKYNKNKWNNIDEMHRVEFSFISSNRNVNHDINVYMDTVPNTPSLSVLMLTRFQLEEDFMLREWKPSQWDADKELQIINSIATAADQKANSVKGTIDELSNDGKLTSVEKKSLDITMRDIAKEKDELIAQANLYGISYGNYNTSYTNLWHWMYSSPGPLGNLNMTSNINRNEMKSKFDDYYAKKQGLIKNITVAGKQQYDNLTIGANNLIRNSNWLEGLKFFYKSDNVSLAEQSGSNWSEISFNNWVNFSENSGTQWRNVTCEKISAVSYRGKKVSVSASLFRYSDCPADSRVSIDFESFDSSGTRIQDLDVKINKDNCPVETWTRFKVEGVTVSSSAVTMRVTIYLERNGHWAAANMKLEVGSKATEWTPHSQDKTRYLVGAETNITENKNQIANVKVEQSRITQTVADHTSKITTINGNISNLTERMKNAEVKIEPDSITQTVITNQKYQQNISSKIDGIKIGGNNLIKNTRYFKDFSHWGWNNKGNLTIEDSTVIHEKYISLRNSSESVEAFIFSDIIKLDPNSDYVLSFKGLCEQNVADAEVWLIGSNNPNNTNHNSYDQTSNFHIEIKNSWANYEFKFHTGSNIRSGYIRFDNNNKKAGTQGYDLMGITAIKLEKGNKASSWSPCIDETFEKIDNIKIGGRNLIENSKDLSGWLREDLVNVYYQNDYTKLSRSESTNDRRGIYKDFNVKPNTDYVFSIKTGLLSGDLFLGIGSSAANMMWNYYCGGYQTLNETNKRYEYKFRTLSNENTIRIYLAVYNDMLNKYNNFTELMLEEGNKSSGWSPAPEDTIKITGGRNLLRNSDKLWFSGSDTPNNVTLSKGRINIKDPNQHFNCYFWPSSDVVEALDNTKTYCFSFDIKINGFPSNVLLEYDFRGGNRPYPEWTTILPNTFGKWQRIHVVIRPNSGNPSSMLACISSNSKPPKISSIEYRNFKLEEGDNPTDWTRAPEDSYTKDEVYNKDQILSFNYQSAAQVQSTVNGLKVNIEQSGGYNFIFNGRFDEPPYPKDMPVSECLNHDNNWRVDNNSNVGDITIGDWSKYGSEYCRALRISVNGSVGGDFAIRQFNIRLEPGTYTFSAKVYSSGALPSYFNVVADWVVNNDPSRSASTQRVSNVNCNISAPNTWTDVRCKFNIPSSVNNQSAVLYDIVLYVGGVRSNMTDFYITSIMINKGDIKPEWAPHPKEIRSGETNITNKGVTVYMSQPDAFGNGIDYSNFSRMDSNGLSVVRGGSTIAYFGEQSSIPHLNSSIINANEIYANNMANIQEDAYFYVDLSNGNDETAKQWAEGEAAWSNPYKSLMKVIDSLGRIWVDSFVTIYVRGTGSEEIRIEGLTGSGSLVINFEKTSKLFCPNFDFIGCTVAIKVDGGKAWGYDQTEAAQFICNNPDGGMFYQRNCTDIWINRLCVCGNNKGSAFTSLGGGCMQVQNCEVDRFKYGFEVVRGGIMCICQCYGSDIDTYLTGDDIGAFFGLSRGDRFTPKCNHWNNENKRMFYLEWVGGTAIEKPGVIYKPSYVPPAPPSATQRTKEWAFTKFSSYASDKGWTKSELIQGGYTGWNSGIYKGTMYLNSDSIRSYLKGSTNVTGSVKFTRSTSSHGVSGKATVHLYLSDGTKVGTLGLNRGESGWIDLNSSHMSKIMSGAVKSLYVYAGNGQSTYIKFFTSYDQCRFWASYKK